MQGAGRPGSAVQWGAWGGAGMALRVPGFMERMARLGLGVLQPPAGLAVLAQVLRGAWRPSATQRAVVLGEVPTPFSRPLVVPNLCLCPCSWLSLWSC